MKKVLSIFLAVVMIITIAPVSFIMTKAKIYSGQCGNSANWSYNTDTSKLTISGSGAMFNFADGNAPWYSYRQSITIVEVETGVTTLGNYSFSSFSVLTAVILKSDIEVIGDGCFKSCTKLVDFNIPNSVTSIGDYAFSGCSSLISITIPDSVTSIGDYAFRSCSALTTSIDIPDSVTIIGAGTFLYCSGLTNVTIGNSVTSIGESAFSDCTGLTNIDIPDSVTTIGKYSFQRCTGLTSVKIGNSVTNIGDSAFSDCSGIKELTMPCSAKIYNGNRSTTFYGCTKIEKIALTKGTGTMQNYTSTSNATDTSYKYTPWYISTGNLKELVLEEGITNIGSYAFCGCNGFTSITIPNSVTSIGSYAFYGCSSLTNVTIGNSVTSIGVEAFWGTGYYKNSDNWKNGFLYIGKYLIEAKPELTGNCNVKAKTKTIADSAFFNCSQITSVFMPESIKNIGSEAFKNCTALTTITLPNSTEHIGNNILSGCSNLKELTIPCSLDFSSSKFSNIPNLETIIISRGNGISPNYSISNYQNTPWFQNRNNIDSLILESGVTHIGNYMFYNNSFSTLILPDTISYVGNSAFDECDNLILVNYYGSEQQWQAIEIEANNEYLTDASIKYNYSVTCITHTPVIVEPYVAPTCTSIGFTEDSYCSVCGQILSKKTEIPKLEHNYSSSIIEPTCTHEGYTTYTCGDCSYSYIGDFVTRAEHSFVDTVTEPTTESQGYTVHTCKDCGYSYVDSITDILPSQMHYIIPSLADIQATVTIKSDENEYSVTAANGVFELDSIKGDVYRVYAKQKNSLTVCVGEYDTKSGEITNDNDIAFPLGDVNGDDVIDIADVSVLLAVGNYGQENAEMDLTGDNIITISDVATALKTENYGDKSVEIV